MLLKRNHNLLSPTVAFCPLFVTMLAILTRACSAGEPAEDPWDDFGVVMSQGEEEAGGSTFARGGASLRLTPRPDTVRGVRMPSLSLNGAWKFLSNPPKGLPDLSQDVAATWPTVEVPGDYRMQGYGAARAVYFRTFEAPGDWQGHRVKLRCDEISSDATVWINGVRVGRHVGHFVAFELDVTEQVRFDRPNTLAIFVKKDSIARSMSGYALHVGGGITRKIELFCVPSINVSRMHATPTFDENYEHASVDVDVELASEPPSDIQKVELHFALTDPAGKPAAFKPGESTPVAIPAGKRVRKRIELEVRSPLHWEAEHPHLYRLSLSLKAGDRHLETVSRRIGFRQVEIRQNELLVNGKPVKLRGVNRHEAHPLRGRSLTPELSRQDAELFKAANCNFVRTSHYPPSEEFIEACDELGLYVEEEAPFCFFNPDDRKELDADTTTRYVVYANLKMVERDLTHPSVIIWSIGNESKWGAHFEAAARAVARLDPSRPRTFMWFPRNAEVLTVAAEHYPTPESVQRVDSDRPKLFSEYCHLPAYVPREMYTDPSVDDAWGRLLEMTWENLYATRGALGGAVWCGVDDVFHVPPAAGESAYRVLGVAAWGVLDGWRRPKPEYWHLLKCYSPLRVLKSRLDAPRPGQALRIPVENRHDFTNLSELKIDWEIGDESGVVTADVAPRSRGEVLVGAAGVADGAVLHLRARDARGRLVDEYQLPIGGASQETRETPRHPTAWKLRATSESFIAESGQVCFRIDRKTGKIAEATVGRRRVLTGGPDFACVPTFSKAQQRAMKGQDPRSTPVYGSHWKADSVSAEQKEGEVRMAWTGSCDEAGVDGSYRFCVTGEVIIEYRVVPGRGIIGKEDLVWVGKAGQPTTSGRFLALVQFREDGTALVKGKRPNEEPVAVPAEQIAAVPRQLGMMLHLPRAVDTLTWRRRSQWSAYPDGHIGRPTGTARAYLPDRDTRETLGQRPDEPWSLAACELGTRDFRSTKANVYRASLKGPEGYGVELISDGNQSARAFLGKEGVRWLIADIHNPASETFMAGYFDRLRRPVPLGRPLSGSIRLRFVGPADASAPADALKGSP